MTHLVPEARLDKNQKLTIRHVKPASADTGKALRNVPPASPITEEGEALSQGLGLRMDAVFLAEKGIRVSEVMKASRRLPNQTAAALIGVLDQDASNEHTFTNLVASALINGESHDTLENIALVYSDYQYQEYDWGPTGAGQYEVIMRDIRGLQQMDRFAGIDNLYRTDRDTRQSAIWMNKMFELAERGGQLTTGKTADGEEYTAFKDDRFIGLVLDNKDQIATVMEAAYEHDADIDMIQRTLDTAPALRDGIL